MKLRLLTSRAPLFRPLAAAQSTNWPGNRANDLLTYPPVKASNEELLPSQPCPLKSWLGKVDICPIEERWATRDRDPLISFFIILARYG